jgi:hypothetical protein
MNRRRPTLPSPRPTPDGPAPPQARPVFRATVDRSVVVAPAGRVTNAGANLGQFVAAETELFRVADPRRLQITASVPPADAGRVREGDRVELTTTDGHTIEGRVRSATGVVDPQSRTATVVVTPTAGGSTLAPGQLVQARILASGGAAKSGVMVPQDAVQTLGSDSVVFVRTGQGFRAQRSDRQPIGWMAITGLKAGTQIATTNAFLLKAETREGVGGMIGRILSLGPMRWLVAFLTLVVIGFGLADHQLPIDAVPDVTNRQVQISTFARRLGRSTSKSRSRSRSRRRWPVFPA